MPQAPDPLAAFDEAAADPLAAFDQASKDPRKRRRVRTRLLEQMGVSGEEMKRRAAEDEPAIQEGEGLRPPTAGENAGAIAAAVAAGATEGVLGSLGLAGDAMRHVAGGGIVRQNARVLRKLVRGELTARDLLPDVTLTTGASGVADTVERGSRAALGVSEEAATTSAAPVVRLATDLAVPVPGGKAARVAREAGLVRPVAAAADDVPRPKADDEIVASAPTEQAAPVTARAEPSVDTAARAEAAHQRVEAAPEPGIGKYAEPSSVNLDRLNVEPEAKVFVVKTAKEIAPELEAAKGAPLTRDEVLEAAAMSDILRKATSREATKASAATLHRTRQHLAAMAKTGKVTPEFIETLRVVSAEATRRGRELQALSIGADPVMASAQTKLVRKLVELGHSFDEIAKAADGVNFKNAKEATAFYRKFVKPSVGDILTEYRYINLLSSPKTHIVNAFSNILQVGVVRPAVRLVSGALDPIASKLTGRPREFYVRQVPAYYRGVMAGFGNALRGAIDELRGIREMEHLDLQQIPTGSKLLAPLQFIPRALSAADTFFRGLAEAGEFEALARATYVKKRRSRVVIRGEERTALRIPEAARETGIETVFRKPLDTVNASGHGALLSQIDKVTNAVHALRKVPGVQWFVPFVETPMNILKQGIEYSPAGVFTLKGSTRPTEQLAKAMIGTTVFAGAGMLALDGRTTWGAPKGKKEREAFFAAGLQPYSVKIGDKWVNVAKLGPLAYPIAIAAAMRHYSMDDAKADGRMNSAAATRTLAGIAGFFSDQSYVQGIGDIVAAVSGDETGWNRVAANMPAQLVPLSSLQRWVAQIVDPVYRKAPRGVSFEDIVDNLKRGIPGLSDDLPGYETPDGKPSKRQFSILNAFSPLNVTQENSRERARYDRRVKAAQRRAQAAERRKAAEARRPDYIRSPASHPEWFTPEENADWPQIEEGFRENDKWLATTHPYRVLPAHLENARRAAVGVQLPNRPAIVEPGAGGAYGRPLDGSHWAEAMEKNGGRLANAVLLVGPGTQTTKLYHELGHGAWSLDIGDAVAERWKKHYEAIVGPVRAIEARLSAIDERVSAAEDAHDGRGPLAPEIEALATRGQQLDNAATRRLPLWSRMSVHNERSRYEDRSDEAFAEAFGWYVSAPSLLKRHDPVTYRWMKTNVFRGREYIGAPNK